MACRTTKLPNGTKMFICGAAMKNAPVCRVCGHLASKLCDYPVGRGKTCDASLCDEHAHLVTADLDYCEPHKRMWENYKASGAVGIAQAELLQLEDVR